jgi:hypothetical protein
MLEQADPDGADAADDAEGSAVDAATDKLLQQLDNGEGVEADEADEEDPALDEAPLLDVALGPLDVEFDGPALLEEP